MLCFSRDTEISQSVQSDISSASKSKGYEGPPSGIVPFHGICMFGNFAFINLIFSSHHFDCSFSILLHLRFARAIVFHISSILHKILSSIDYN